MKNSEKIPAKLNDFEAIRKIVFHLRAPDGCPWDLEQTHKTLSKFAIEEAFELAEAIELDEPDKIKDELGDMLLQVMLHSEIADQSNKFNIFDVIENLSKKMIRRHPHVFADTKVNNVDDVYQNWAKTKAKEKGNKKEEGFGIPKGLPELIKSFKIGAKTKVTGFDFKDQFEALEKSEEELKELKTALQENSNIEEEIGDLLFSISQVSRHVGLDSEQCLRKANLKFEKRYFSMLKLAENDGLKFEELGREQKEEFWIKVKNAEKS